MRPAGTPASSRSRSQSATGRPPSSSLKSGTRMVRAATRLATVSNLESVASSARPSAVQHRAQSASFAAPIVR